MIDFDALIQLAKGAVELVTALLALRAALKPRKRRR
jgi:hypothetical protein